METLASEAITQNISAAVGETVVMRQEKDVRMFNAASSPTEEAPTRFDGITRSQNHTKAIVKSQRIRSESKIKRGINGRVRFLDSSDPLQQPRHHYHYLPNGPARRSKYDVAPKSLRETFSVSTSSKTPVNTNSQFEPYPSASTAVVPVSPTASVSQPSYPTSGVRSTKHDENKEGQTHPQSPDLNGKDSTNQADSRLLEHTRVEEEDMDVDDEDEDELRFGKLGSRQRESREFMEFWRERYRDLVNYKLSMAYAARGG